MRVHSLLCAKHPTSVQNTSAEHPFLNKNTTPPLQYKTPHPLYTKHHPPPHNLRYHQPRSTRQIRRPDLPRRRPRRCPPPLIKRLLHQPRHNPPKRLPIHRTRLSHPVRPEPHQRLDHLHVQPLLRTIQHRPPVIVQREDVRAPAQHPLNAVVKPAEHRPPQRGIAPVVPRIHVRPVRAAEQHAHELAVRRVVVVQR